MEIINILAVIISPIVAVLISFWVSHHSSLRNDKMNILKILLIHQNAPINQQRIEALNLVNVVFHRNKNIVAQMRKYKRLHDDLTASMNIQGPPPFIQKAVNLNDAYIKLVELIAANLGYGDAMDWDNLKNAIIPKCYKENDQTVWY